MSITHHSKVVASFAKLIMRAKPLVLAMTGLLSMSQAQALLPIPSTLVDSGALANNASSAKTTAHLSAINTDIAKPVSLATKGASTKSAIDTQQPTVKAEQNTNDKLVAAQLPSAQAEQLLARWRKQAEAKNLAQHTTWRRLLYFLDDKNAKLAKGENQSLINNPKFFLSPNGQQDSAAELDAMLVALANQLTSTDKSSNDNTAACRFPARTQWLAQSLDIDQNSLQAKCPKLDQWVQTLDAEQLSVMFAEEYLDNPISAFAHTLLRIDSPKSAADFTQIYHAYAFNDTVDGDADDAFLIYAIKSISGGYNNIIEIDPYPEKLAAYLKEDERDTWTYQLALTPAEVQQIILHIWETEDLDIPYYFTTDNCASEILRLIDVVRPQQHLLSALPYVVVPSDVINLLNQQNLLASSRYTPSDSSVRQAELNQAKLAAKLGYREKLAPSEIDKIKSPSNPASSLLAGGQILAYPKIEVADNNPLDRHPLQRAHIGIGQRGDNAYVDIGLRAGFHDTLDRVSGYPQFFNLEGLKATLRFYDQDDSNNNDRVELQNFTLIQGRSFNPANAAKQGNTWGVNIEATQVNDGSQPEGESHLVGSGAFEYGKSWVFGSPPTSATSQNEYEVSGEMPQQLCYALATGALQGGRGLNNGFRVGAGVNAGCRYQFNKRLRLQAELQLPYWYHGDSNQSEVQSHYWQPISTLGVQYDIDKQQALRLNTSYDWQDRIADNDEVQLSYLRYF